MNDANRESIIKMIADGTLRPEEGAKLLARLSEEDNAAKQSAQTAAEASTKKVKAERTDAEKPAPERVSIKGADGTSKVIDLPPGLVPMVTKLIAEQIKEHTIRVARETATGAKNMVLNKFDEVKDTVKTAVQGGNKKSQSAVEEKPKATPEEEKQAAARRQILAMVQTGRISAVDAGKLIRELDALQDFEKNQAEPPPTDASGGGKKRR